MASPVVLTPPRRQHTVSKVVLRRFLHRGKISVYDRQRDVICCKGPNGVFVDQLDRHDPWGAEARWGEVETKMARVYPLIDNRSVLDDDDAIDSLRDLVAMHWIRTPAFRQAHERAKAAVLAQSIQNWDARPDLLAVALKQRTGLYPGSSATLTHYNRMLHTMLLDEAADEMMSGSLARLYAGARKMFAEFEVEIGYSAQWDFVIGDAPVIVRKDGHDGLGLHQGVALGDACEIAMPISPHVIVAMSKTRRLVTLDDHAVDRYNQMQSKTFVRWIGCRPGCYSDRAMRRNAPAKRIYA